MILLADRDADSHREIEQRDPNLKYENVKCVGSLKPPLDKCLDMRIVYSGELCIGHIEEAVKPS